DFLPPSFFHHGGRAVKNLQSAGARIQLWRGKWLLSMAGVLLGLLSLAVVWKYCFLPQARGPAGDEEPRLTFETPYRNVRPDVKYVGDQVCAKCHAREYDSYRHHPWAGLWRRWPPRRPSSATSRRPSTPLSSPILLSNWVCITAFGAEETAPFT